MGSRLPASSSEIKRRLEAHKSDNWDGEEYEPSEFGNFADYFRRKKIKLQNQDALIRAEPGAADKPQIFSGVVAHITGYTVPSLNDLHRELVHHGAYFLRYLDSKTMVTHIIASDLPPKKAHEFRAYRVVRPAWVTDSIRAGRMLPWTDYRSADQEGTGQARLTLGPGRRIVSQSASAAKSRIGSGEQTNKEAPADPTTALQDKNPPDQDMTVDADQDMIVEVEPPSVPDREPDTGEKDGHHDPASKQETALPRPPKPVTSEEHNARLLSDPRIRNASCANPDFLNQFYSESRLHHLSTWKAELKTKMQRLAAERAPAAKAPPVRQAGPGQRRYIMHVDFDSFFCAVSLKRNPELADKPAAVAHGAGNGSEIASCNYPARQYGVKNGMWTKRALEMCPDLKVLPYDFPGYEEASRLFYESILDVGCTVQSVSVDEALIDVTAIALAASGSGGGGAGSVVDRQVEGRAVEDVGLELRAKVKEKTGCAVSVGIGPNVLLARVALRKAKPAGQFHIKPEDVSEAMAELEVVSLPGVAGSIGSKLKEMGAEKVRDLRLISRERLADALGPKTGLKLWEYGRGIDPTDVGQQPARKSVSADVNWGIRFVSQQEAEEFVRSLSGELEKRLRNEQVRGRQLTVKIMRRSADAPLDPEKHLGHGRCDTFVRAVQFGVATHSANDIGREAVSVLRSYRFSPGDLRGLGLQLTKLEPIKIEASQKKLPFTKSSSGGGGQPGKIVDQVEDKVGRREGGDKQKGEGDSPSPRKWRGASTDIEDDRIVEDPVTPRKYNKLPSSLAQCDDLGGGIRGTPLNMAGTQFILPSNPDPTVVAALPMDIRARLMAQGRRGASAHAAGGGGGREASPPSPVSGPGSPPGNLIPSQVDPEVFNALPDDIKAEILASYGGVRRPDSRPPSRQQLPLPRASPGKDRRAGTSRAAAPAPPQLLPPGGRGGGVRHMFERMRERQADGGQRLLPPPPPPVDPAVASEAELDLAELDREFLDQLPEDVRLEVIEDHRRRRHARLATVSRPISRYESYDGSGLPSQPSDGEEKEEEEEEADSAQASVTPGEEDGTVVLNVPAPPAKVPFPGSGITTVAEIEDMLRGWHAATRAEGPHASDLAMLERYLARVVLEERDMDKAASIVRILECVVGLGDGGGRAEEGRAAWARAVDKARDAIRAAARERGLGALRL